MAPQNLNACILQDIAMLSEVRVLHLEMSERCNAACPLCARTNGNGAGDPSLTHELRLVDLRSWLPAEVLKSLSYVYMCGNFGDPISRPRHHCGLALLAREQPLQARHAYQWRRPRGRMVDRPGQRHARPRQMSSFRSMALRTLTISIAATCDGICSSVMSAPTSAPAGKQSGTSWFFATTSIRSRPRKPWPQRKDSPSLWQRNRRALQMCRPMQPATRSSNRRLIRAISIPIWPGRNRSTPLMAAERIGWTARPSPARQRRRRAFISALAAISGRAAGLAMDQCLDHARIWMRSWRRTAGLNSCPCASMRCRRMLHGPAFRAIERGWSERISGGRLLTCAKTCAKELDLYRAQYR